MSQVPHEKLAASRPPSRTWAVLLLRMNCVPGGGPNLAPDMDGWMMYWLLGYRFVLFFFLLYLYFHLCCSLLDIVRYCDSIFGPNKSFPRFPSFWSPHPSYINFFFFSRASHSAHLSFTPSPPHKPHRVVHTCSCYLNPASFD